MDKETLLKLKEKGEAVLIRFFALTNGNISHMITFGEAVDEWEWGWTDEECDQVEDYLVGKGFIKRQTLGGTRIASFSLTRLGWNHAEHLILKEPKKSRSNNPTSGINFGPINSAGDVNINLSHVAGRDQNTTTTSTTSTQQASPAAANQSNTIPSSITPAKFNELLREQFNESELKDVCLVLKIDYESLAGNSKADKTRELILYLQRRGRVPELLILVKQERPNIPWPDTISD